MIFHMTSTREITVHLVKGLHLVPCSRVVELVRDFDGEVSIHWNDIKADAKSIFDLMTLAAPHGSVLTVEVVGDGAEGILDRLEQLFVQDATE
jgi:phosphocarrier protein HPr